MSDLRETIARLRDLEAKATAGRARDDSVDMTGRRVGKLTVLERRGSDGRGKDAESRGRHCSVGVFGAVRRSTMRLGPWVDRSSRSSAT